MLTFRKNGEGYEVFYGVRTLGFVMKHYLSSLDAAGRVSVSSRWSAVDMEENGQDFPTRQAAANWLLSRAVAGEKPGT